MTTLAALVRDQATKRPAEPAVVCGDQVLSWADLDTQVAGVAGTLRRLGVARGDRVGILLYKSTRTVVAVHAVLRCGAAYVPLDASAPTSAVAAVVDDCGVEVVITDEPSSRHIATLAAQAPSLRAVLGADDDALGASGLVGAGWASDDVIDEGDGPQVDDLAYVMYTSGSTGRPKGIMHTHRSALAYATRAAALYGLGPDDRLGFLTPIHFDMSTFELFAGPVAGACTVVVPEPYLRLPASLSQLIADQAVTTLYGVPFLYTQLLDRGVLTERDLSAVRWVLYGGEPFPAARLAQWMRLLPECRVSNVYGPAEVNQCTFHHLDAPPATDAVVPIGRCWDGARGRVVDDDGHDCPPGEPGELVIAAPTMMIGYWNRPELTEQSIDVDSDGRRWYHTGDLATEVEPGVFEYVGRRDDQVKVRGHRLELGTVELILAAADGVSHAVAGVVTGAEGETELVAVYVGSAPADELTRWAAERLAPYAVPRRLERVDDLCQTATGKVDRRRVRHELMPELFTHPQEALAR
ncbi:MAG: amino acid adenylation domain-containing protein [Acidimicrobiia bacterium]|nr:amino acid adenylation domain-containing protein [Acidimicrobiia bacterium]